MQELVDVKAFWCKHVWTLYFGTYFGTLRPTSIWFWFGHPPKPFQIEDILWIFKDGQKWWRTNWWFFRIDFYLCVFLLKTVDSPEVARSALVKFVDPIFFLRCFARCPQITPKPQNATSTSKDFKAPRTWIVHSDCLSGRFYRQIYCSRAALCAPSSVSNGGDPQICIF